MTIKFTLICIFLFVIIPVVVFLCARFKIIKPDVKLSVITWYIFLSSVSICADVLKLPSDWVDIYFVFAISYLFVFEITEWIPEFKY